MTEREILEALREVIDPELGIDIVALGLVRAVEIDETGGVHVSLTMTTPACPLGGLIARQAEESIRARVHGVVRAAVQIVDDPPWDPARMSAAAKETLGW